jgi:hypothetical protein
VTQFCMARYDGDTLEEDGVVFKPIDQDILFEAKKQLSEGKQVWNVFYNGKNIDMLCCEAQRNLNDNVLFTETELYNLINKLTSLEIEFWCWYGDDFLELNDISSIETLNQEIAKSISEPQCEVYFHWLVSS